MKKTGNTIGIICSAFMITICAAAFIWKLVRTHEFAIIWLILLGIGACGLWLCLDEKKTQSKEKQSQSPDAQEG